MLFLECSAKTGENIQAVFATISDTISARIEKGEIDPKNESIGVKMGSLQLEKSNNQGSKKQCC